MSDVNDSTQSTQGGGGTPITGIDLNQQFATSGASGGSSSGRIGTFQATDLAGNTVSPAIIHQTLETVQQALHTMSSPQRDSHERSFHGQAVHYRSTDLVIQTCPEELRKRNDWLENIEDALISRSSGIRWKERQVSLRCVPDGQPWKEGNIVERTFRNVNQIVQFHLAFKATGSDMKRITIPLDADDGQVYQVPVPDDIWFLVGQYLWGLLKPRIPDGMKLLPVCT